MHKLNSTHDTKECRALQGEKKGHTSGHANNQSSSSAFSAGNFKEIKCGNGCGKIYTKGHNLVCEKRKQVKFGKTVVNPEEDISRFSLSEQELVDEASELNCMGQGDNNSEEFSFLSTKIQSTEEPKFIYAPLLKNGVRVMGGVDTMASHSFLSPGFARDLKLTIQPAKGVIWLANSDNSCERQGQSREIEVRHKEVNVFHTFEILNLGLDQGRPINCIIGIDLISKLGISVAGISCRFPDDLVINIEHCSIKENNYTGAKHQDDPNVISFIQSQLNENFLISGFCTDPLAEITLDTGNADPICINQYRIDYSLNPVIQQQIDEWLKLGVIVESNENSSWNCPLLVVNKHDVSGAVSGRRVCIDPRALNLRIPSVHFPLPLIRDVLESFTECVVFSKIYLKSGFTQIKVRECDRVKTTFTWKGQKFCFQGAPFGLKHVPACFQQILSRVVKPCSEFCKVSVDDIIIGSRTLEEHPLHVRRVIECLNAVNLRINLTKCEFGRPEISALGHRIDKHGIRLAREKLVAMDAWKPPTSGKMIEKQMGFLNYFRDMIPQYSTLTAPIEKMRHLKHVVWEKEHQEIYRKLRAIMESDLILSYPDFSTQFQIATDASSMGIGAVLFQLKNGKKHYLMFASKSLSKSERHYGASKRELLAVIFALHKFAYYLRGNKFKLFTDNKALTFMLTQKKTLANATELA